MQNNKVSPEKPRFVGKANGDQRFLRLRLTSRRLECLRAEGPSHFPVDGDLDIDVIVGKRGQVQRRKLRREFLLKCLRVGCPKPKTYDRAGIAKYRISDLW